jgi:hypothetical protein
MRAFLFSSNMLCPSCGVVLVYKVTRPEADVLYETATYPGALERSICAGVCPIHFLSDLLRCG